MPGRLSRHLNTAWIQNSVQQACVKQVYYAQGLALICFQPGCQVFRLILLIHDVSAKTGGYGIVRDSPDRFIPIAEEDTPLIRKLVSLSNNTRLIATAFTGKYLSVKTFNHIVFHNDIGRVGDNLNKAHVANNVVSLDVERQIDIRVLVVKGNAKAGAAGFNTVITDVDIAVAFATLFRVV